MRLAIGIFAAAALTATLPVYADECPASVLAGVQKSHKGAKTTECLHETDDGDSYYVVSIQTAAGKKLELDMSPDGKIIETVEYITAAEVPAAVTKGLEAKYPGAKITEVDRVTDQDGEVTFDIEFTAGGKTQEVTLTTTGEVYEFDEDDDRDGNGDHGHEDDNGHHSDGKV